MEEDSMCICTAAVQLSHPLFNKQKNRDSVLAFLYVCVDPFSQDILCGLRFSSCVIFGVPPLFHS